MTSCLRNELGVNEVMRNDLFFKRVLRILEEFQEEEIVANTSKIVRLVLRDEVYYDKAITQFPQLGNFLLQLMSKHFFSVAIIQETTSALRNYTRKPTYLNYINADQLKILINVIKEPKFEKQKPISLQIIKNVTKSQDHERYLKQLGVTDIIMMANMQNQINTSLGQNIVGNALQSNFKPR